MKPAQQTQALLDEIIGKDARPSAEERKIEARISELGGEIEAVTRQIGQLNTNCGIVVRRAGVIHWSLREAERAAFDDRSAEQQYTIDTLRADLEPLEAEIATIRAESETLVSRRARLTAERRTAESRLQQLRRERLDTALT